MKNKNYFTVSADKRFHPDLTNINLSTPNEYVSYKTNYAKYLKSTIPKNHDLEKNKLILQKYEHYLDAISHDLNELHNEKLSTFFWKKSLGLSFKRYISILELAYSEFSKFDPKKYEIYMLLDSKSFFTPNDFVDQRSFLQHSDLGREQLFSMYINFYYPDLYNSTPKISIELPSNTISLSFFSKIKSFFKQTQNYFFTDKKSAVVGIFDSFFTKKNRDNLIKNSGIININIKFNKPVSVVSDNRSNVCKSINIQTNFDAFFIYSAKYLFPKFFIEDFLSNKKFYINELDNYPNLKYIICEAWISNTRDSFILALAREKYNIMHIYNEHNTLTHPFIGDSTNLLSSMVDVYFTMGWKRDGNNFKKGSSLFFEESDSSQIRKDHQILFIDAAAFAHRIEYCTKESEHEFCATSFFNFLKVFFMNISGNVQSEITYRGYPADQLKWKMYDNKSILSEYFPANVKLDDFSLPGSTMMKRSRLVIISYTNTAYLQSLALNIPTIFFWNKNVSHLNDGYSNFFESLIDVGICQTDPIEAANFVGQIEDDIDGWWNSIETQEAKNLFLKTNLGLPNNAMEYYLSLLKK
ncbi:LIC12162 family protein [Gammaproteobacteria bacterium]|nr:LIC12162 family protein [Gammaproteobacteria bacterium]